MLIAYLSGMNHELLQRLTLIIQDLEASNHLMSAAYAQMALDRLICDTSTDGEEAAPQDPPSDLAEVTESLLSKV